MIAIDTNVLVRLLARDDEKQFQKAVSLFAENDIFIAATALLETQWVLRYTYNFAPEAILDAFGKTFGLPNVHIQNPESIAQAIDLARKGLDFADALHLASSRECRQLVTFDAKFIKKTKGLTKCKVKQI